MRGPVLGGLHHLLPGLHRQGHQEEEVRGGGGGGGARDREE